MSDKSMHKRPIRSYVVRGGRLTPSQQEAIENLWPLYGIDSGVENAIEPGTEKCGENDAGLINREAIFGRQAELVFEIGFGMGDSLVAMAAQHPERDYIGIDVHPPGIGTILRDIHEKGLTNLRVMQGDAMEVLAQGFGNESLDRVQIFFPDPWHKKRHHKRRMIQAPFVDSLASRLRPGGILHLATDWENYAEQMMEVMSASPRYRNMAGTGQFALEHERVETKFERRGRRLGHGVWDLLFERV